jgi:hypothetical protein
VVPEHGFRLVSVEVGGSTEQVEQPVSAEIDGVPALYRVLRAGPDDSRAQDWAILEVFPGPHDLGRPGELTLEVDGSRAVGPDECVLVIGYPAVPGRGEQRPQVLLTRTFRDLPTGQTGDGLLRLHDPQGRPRRGMSGSPALLWEPHRRRAVVLGVLSSSSRAQRQWMVLRVPSGRALDICRVPAAAFEGLEPEPPWPAPVLLLPAGAAGGGGQGGRIEAPQDGARQGVTDDHAAVGGGRGEP